MKQRGAEKYIGDPSNYFPYALEFGKFAVARIYKKLTSPSAKVEDAFVLGYYLPWLIFAKGLDDSVFSEDQAALFDKLTVESFIYEAATALQLDVDRDYIYNIKSNALIEKHSMSQKILIAWRDGKEFMAFNFGLSLSESIITSNNAETRNRCITEAENWARKLEWDSEAERALKSLRTLYDKLRFDDLVERIALAFIKDHEK